MMKVSNAVLGELARELSTPRSSFVSGPNGDSIDIATREADVIHYARPPNPKVGEVFRDYALGYNVEWDGHCWRRVASGGQPG